MELISKGLLEAVSEFLASSNKAQRTKECVFPGPYALRTALEETTWGTSEPDLANRPYPFCLSVLCHCRRSVQSGVILSVQGHVLRGSFANSFSRVLISLMSFRTSELIAPPLPVLSQQSTSLQRCPLPLPTYVCSDLRVEILLF